MSAGLAGVLAEGAVAAIVAAKGGERNEDFFRVADDVALALGAEFGCGAQQFLQWRLRCKLKGSFARDGMECGLHLRAGWGTKEIYHTRHRGRSKAKLDSCERLGSAEKILDRGTNDAGRRFRGGLEAVAADQDDGGTFGLAHEEAGGGGELVGDGKDRRG